MKQPTGSTPLLDAMIRKSILWLMLTCAAFVAQAAETEPKPIPYRAVYQVSMGSLSATAIEELREVAPGSYTVSQNMDSMVAEVNESSRFRIVDGRLRPEVYDYEFSAFFKKRVQKEVFNWKTGVVTHTYKERTSRDKIGPGTYDRFSSRLQLREDLAAGLKEMEYTVAEKGRLRKYQFAVGREELIRTPLGSLRAVKVTRVREEGSKRQTHLWLAMDWDYILVALHQLEKDGSTMKLELTEAVTGGRRVTGHVMRSAQ